MSARPPIPTRLLYPVIFACTVVVALVLFGVPDLITLPIAVITVVWIGVLVARHYLSGSSEGQREQEGGGA